MKRITMLFVAAAMSFFTVSAGAADILSPNSNYTGPDLDAPYAFSGLAIGVDGGGQFNAWDIDAGTFSFDGISSDGLIGGVHADYLFALNRNMRLGVYAEGGWSDVATSFSAPGFSAELKQDTYYGGGAKIGATVHGTFVYLRGGYDRSQWTISAPGFDVSAGADSWLFGGGIDTMVSDHVSFGGGVDYLVVDDADVAGESLKEFLGNSEIIRARARLSYHF